VPAAPPATDTIPRLLAGHVRAGPAVPAVTWLDPAASARVELSRATLANWVAKIGGLLQDVIEVDGGDRVHLQLPAHWLAVAWPLACWSVGGVVVPEDVTGPAEVVVTGDTRSPDPAPSPAPGQRTVVVGLSPLGGRSRCEVPPGALDAGAEVLGQPDDLVAYQEPTGGSPALAGSDHAGLIAAAGARAAELDLRPGCRLATDVPPCTAAGLVETVLAPLVVGGSLVLLVGADRSPLAAERPDASGGSLRG